MLLLCLELHYVSEARFEDSESVFKQALSLHPEHPSLSNNFSNLLIQLERYSEAHDIFANFVIVLLIIKMLIIIFTVFCHLFSKSNPRLMCQASHRQQEVIQIPPNLISLLNSDFLLSHSLTHRMMPFLFKN